MSFFHALFIAKFPYSQGIFRRVFASIVSF
nr:MAG TPA: hypothetical protein [Caudoviricetes sp.]